MKSTKSLLCVLVFACSSEDPKATLVNAGNTAAEKASALAVDSKELGAELADKGLALGKNVASQGVTLGKDLANQGVALGSEFFGKTQDALLPVATKLIQSSKEALLSLDASKLVALKQQFDRVYQNQSGFDFAVHTETLKAGDLAARQQRIASMPNLTIGNLTIGYEDMGSINAQGRDTQTNFGATWIEGDKQIAFVISNKTHLDRAGMIDMLTKLAPLVSEAARK